MNSKKSVLIICVVCFFALFLSACQQGQTEENFLSADKNANINTVAMSKTSNSSNLMSEAKQTAEKIEVVHFHATQQCWSCITVGEYALKTIKDKFPEEYANGKIMFKDINSELPANRDMVMKYQARGSSLFVNAITNGRDNIEEDIAVWRLVTNKNQFISYFEDKLNKLLGSPR